MERCNKFKEWLIEQGLIRKVQGVGVAIYPKEMNPADEIRNWAIKITRLIR